jgi:hypothetical protein
MQCEAIQKMEQHSFLDQAKDGLVFPWYMAFEIAYADPLIDNNVQDKACSVSA